MRVEPKTFFANERTFLTWLHMAVTIGTIAAALLGFSGSAQRSEKPKYGVSTQHMGLGHYQEQVVNDVPATHDNQLCTRNCLR